MRRMLDIVASLAGLIFLSPLLAVLAVGVRCGMGRPVFFRQSRPGYKGRLFTLYKFRTMRDAAGPDGKPLADAERLAPLGRWMRKWSLDELPELFNVLMGNMSLVGPRPLLPQYLGRYSPEQARRHEVTPGVTGWAQVNGRNLLSWPERIALDVWYARHASLGLDLKIVLRTAGVVLRREGLFGPEGANKEF